MNDKIKKVICNYLVKDLYNVEIIYYRDSIWFIDRENRYWYFEYHKVDKHLWWRWSHFTQSLKIFSMDGEKEQSIFGELVNMILTKKQILEAKYPNKIFKTVGSVMNFEDKVDKVLNSEVKTTGEMNAEQLWEVDKVLNCEVEKTAPMASVVPSWVDKVLNNEVETTDGYGWKPKPVVDEVLNFEVETTAVGASWSQGKVDDILNYEVEKTLSGGARKTMDAHKVLDQEIKTTIASHSGVYRKVDEVLNNEVETTSGSDIAISEGLDEVLNCEVETTAAGNWGAFFKVDEVLNCEVETTGFVSSPRDISMGEVLDSDVKIRSGELTEENEMMDKVLSVDIETIGYSKTHRLRPVTGALDYNDNPVEIKSIEKLKGENPFQDIIVSHILDESDKVTDKLKMKEDDYVKTYSHDVYMCDHLVQNVLDIGVNSIHYDTHNHQPIVDGILKKA